MTAVQAMFFLLLAPVLVGIVIAILPKSHNAWKSIIFILGLALNFAFSLYLFFTVFHNQETVRYLFSWGGPGLDFAISVDHLSGSLILFAALFALLIGIYSVYFSPRRMANGLYYLCYIFSLVALNGSLMVNNLVLILFFSGIGLIILVGILLAENPRESDTALKAMFINGIPYFLLMVGLSVTAQEGGSRLINEIARIPLEGNAIFGFVCLVLGAVGLMGIMPFHSEMKESVTVMPLPGMVFVSMILDKILPVYLLGRAMVSFYEVIPQSGPSQFMVLLGLASALLGAVFAIGQKDYKRVLLYLSISQAGLILLAFGTAQPIGTAAAFAILCAYLAYMTALFLGAGALELETGTTEIAALGGLRHSRPYLTICFFGAALALVGFPPLNGFFANTMLLEAAHSVSPLAFAVVLLALLCSMIALIRLGDRVYFHRQPAKMELSGLSHGPLLGIIVVLVLLCFVFGLGYPYLFQVLIRPFLGDQASALAMAAPWNRPLFLLIIVGLLVLAAGLYFLYRSQRRRVKRAIARIGQWRLVAVCNHWLQCHSVDPYDLFLVLIGYISSLAVLIAKNLHAALQALHHFLFTRLPYWLRSKGKRGVSAVSSKFSMPVSWFFSAFGLVIVLVAVLIAL